MMPEFDRAEIILFMRTNRVILKSVILVFLAYMAKKLIDYLFKKDTKTIKEDAPNKNDNVPVEEHVVNEKDQLNYYYNTYIKQIESEEHKHIAFSIPRYSPKEMKTRATAFFEEVNMRRSCRFFSTEPVSRTVIEQCVHAAGTSPSGAHTEPWHFVAVYGKEDKAVIREIVEEEEQLNYERRMGSNWLKDLAKVKTTFVKEYITEAPCIILVFKVPFHHKSNGEKFINWYYEASVSLAVGILLCALNNVGLVTLTSTPMNCGPALRRLVNRPEHEKLAFLLPIGYPAKRATVPDLQRKPIEDILTVLG